MPGSPAPADGDVLLVVDVQNDFCPGGALAVADGAAVVPVVNRLAATFADVVMTQDWHPAGHGSFASSHPGREPFEEISLGGCRQVLWPDHCIQDTAGAAFRDDLDIPHCALVVRKGLHRNIDSYSAFLENDRSTPTGLAGALRERGLRRLFVCGLAYDFCVRYSAEDAAALGFEAVVVADACRPVALAGSVAAADEAFARSGIGTVEAASLIAARTAAAAGA